jgi:hypothetical protein
VERLNPNIEWERFVFQKGNSTIEIIKEKVFDEDEDFEEIN